MLNPIRTLVAALSIALASVAMAADPVDINSADAAALAQAINGVGVKRARAIVAYREQHGPFRSVDELVQVAGIGERIVERSRERLQVGADAR